MNTDIKITVAVVMVAGPVKSTGKSPFIHPTKNIVIKSSDISVRGEIVIANVIIIAYITIHGINKNFLSFMKFNTFIFLLLSCSIYVAYFVALILVVRFLIRMTQLLLLFV